MYHILIADDEPKIVELLSLYLEMQDCKVYAAYDGEEALQIFRKHHIDMLLADIMMPKLNGYDLIKKIRVQSQIPVMIISAKIDLSDKIVGLNLGADDYITKPFDALEVAARVTANLRRCYGYHNITIEKQQLTYKNLILDPIQCIVLQDEQPLDLTATEYRMIKLFMENTGRVLTKNQIYEGAWAEDAFPDDNSIMVAISKLRNKMRDEEFHYIKTIRGLGYRMEKE